MKKICVVTSTRADYGILKPLLHTIQNNEEFELFIVATGMHLAMEFGFTCQEIESDGFNIHRKIDILITAGSVSSVSKTMGMALISFGQYFEEHRPDLLIVLGDRYEIMAVCCAAVNECIPIAHLHGGETTEGAIDECYRHSITKMGSLHFTICETYRKRVIQLGEQPDCVFNVGAMGVENILRTPLLSLDKLGASIRFDLRGNPYSVVTFHPVTLEDGTGANQLRALMTAMDKFPDIRYIVTKSNSDKGGREINQIWEEYVNSRDNCILVASLGMKRYLSALKYAAAIVGNSSSGILEGPASKIPTVDIGDRQKGRIRADSVIHCEPVADEIAAAMQKAFSSEFQAFSKTVSNPYGDGNTSSRIVEIISDRLDSGILLKKSFYDIEFEVNA